MLKVGDRVWMRTRYSILLVEVVGTVVAPSGAWAYKVMRPGVRDDDGNVVYYRLDPNDVIQ